MNSSLPPLLIVDDEPNMRLSLETVMRDEGYAVRTVESAEAAQRAIDEEEPFMVITDARLKGMSGYELLTSLRTRRPGLPVLLITAYATPRLAAEAIKAGAIDYLAKPFAPEELLHAVARCAERHRLLTENASLRARAVEPYRLDQIIGESPGILELRQLIQTVAPTQATVLILGESGTGKELIAGALHTLSERRAQSYVRLNCAAIPEALLESELFGHEKGAFTGAIKQKPGRVEEAHGGTVFLDEIGDMSRPLQAKLLRFLEDGSFTRVGGNQELRVDVRLIAATNRNIIEAIKAGDFREDLYHRLNVVQFRPPALRDRGEDVLLLAGHFLQQFNAAMKKSVRSISKPAQKLLLSHNWPGNVRELRNVIERAVILEPGPEVTPASLPDFRHESALRQTSVAAPALIAGSLEQSLEHLERQFILEALERHRYSLGRTAEHLGLTRHALRYRLARLNIDVDGGPEDQASLRARKETSS